MARIRSIKPDAWQDPRVGKLSIEARMLWVVLLTMSDDEGRFLAQTAVIAGHGYAFDDAAIARIPVLLDELHASGLVRLYVVEDVRYGVHPRWSSHQKIDRKTPSRLPSPTLDEDSTNAPRASAEPLDADSSPERRGEERSKEAATAASPATASEDAGTPNRAADIAPEPVRKMLATGGFQPLEIEQSDAGIRQALLDLSLPDDVDWWRFGQEIQRHREAGRMRRATPVSAIRFVARSADGPPRLGNAPASRGQGPPDAATAARRAAYDDAVITDRPEVTA